MHFQPLTFSLLPLPPICPVQRFGREADGPITVFKARCAGPKGDIPKDVPIEAKYAAYQEVRGREPAECAASHTSYARGSLPLYARGRNISQTLRPPCTLVMPPPHHVHNQFPHLQLTHSRSASS